MQIIKADILGFCFGVRRAVELAQSAIIENPDKKIHSLGPLIHNETVLTELEKKGLDIISEEDIEKLDNSDVVIIRAHGAGPDIIKKLENRKCKIIDATCPKVTISQKLVSKISTEADYVIFTGDRNHGEVKSIQGCGTENFILIQNAIEAENFCLQHKLETDVKIFILSQTTFSAVTFAEICRIFENCFKNIEIKNTICSATKERQNSLLKLCNSVDCVLVIGGKKSANTKRLFEIAQKNCQKAFLIQGKEDIPEEVFNFEKIGITAGASTPDLVIEEVEKTLCC